VTVETSIYTALKNLVSNRVYRKVAPTTVTALPRITFQQVGGESVVFLDSATVPSKNNGRFQVNVWHNTSDEASSLARVVRDTLHAYVTLHAKALGEPVGIYEEATNLHGTMQDFSMWFDA
jgi:hypothetical protein